MATIAKSHLPTPTTTSGAVCVCVCCVMIRPAGRGCVRTPCMCASAVHVLLLCVCSWYVVQPSSFASLCFVRLDTRTWVESSGELCDGCVRMSVCSGPRGPSKWLVLVTWEILPRRKNVAWSLWAGSSQKLGGGPLCPSPSLSVSRLLSWVLCVELSAHSSKYRDRLCVD